MLLKIRAQLFNSIGLYLLIFLFLTSCNENRVTSSVQTQKIVLQNANITPQIIRLSGGSADTTITVYLSVVVTDSSLLKGSPHYLIKDVLTNQSAGGGSLSSYNSSNNTYSGHFPVQLSPNQSGELQITIYALDKNNQMTNTYIGTVKVYGQAGKPPKILYATNPDTVHIPTSGTLNVDFKAKVVDPDGQNNIDYVKLDLQKDGTSSVISYQLYDDGSTTNLNGSNSGDAVASDSVYTRRFQIDSNTSPNSFTIRYYAFDKNGLGSDTVTTHFVISQ